ncbi:CBS domain-containing protein [Streptomyces marokkonensis]|uniref:CBS domain-containing protein n=1 Tax=Streptomyces marokkonensis TaxID=324855 RepID=A0ABW6Q539_9ACTN
MTAAPVTVGPQTSVAQVARALRDRGLGAVLVTEGDRLRGLVTDRDLAVRPVSRGVDTEETTVAGACGDDLVTVAPDDDLDHVVRLAVERDPEPAIGVCATRHRGPVGQWLQKEDDAS